MKNNITSQTVQNKHYCLQDRVDNIQFPFGIERDQLKADFISHDHDHIELLFIMHGTALHVIHGKDYFLKPGDVWAIMPGVEHCFKNVKSLDVVNMVFYPNFLERFNKDVSGMEVFKSLFSDQPPGRKKRAFPNHTHLIIEVLAIGQQLIEEIMGEMKEKQIAYQTVVQSLLLRLLVLINRFSVQKQENEIPKATGRFASVIGYVESHYLEKLSLAKLVNLSGLSSARINKHFKNNFQMTLSEYLISLRLEHAKEMLGSSTSPITDIALQSGFRDNNYFSRVFKNRMRMTPSKYRENISDRRLMTDSSPTR